MFERFRRAPEQDPSQQLRSELADVSRQIEDLKEQITAWNEPVPADRDLLERLNARKAELEEQLEDQEGKKAA